MIFLFLILLLLGGGGGGESTKRTDFAYIYSKCYEKYLKLKNNYDIV